MQQADRRIEQAGVSIDTLLDSLKKLWFRAGVQSVTRVSQPGETAVLFATSRKKGFKARWFPRLAELEIFVYIKFIMSFI
jgi:hypothetical protein